MELIKLTVFPRQKAKEKGAAKRLRASGQIPGVLYGAKDEPVSLQVDEKEFIHLIHGRGGEHAIVELEFDGKPDLNSPAMLKGVQHHPVRGDVLHADFLRIRLDERIQTVVPIVLQGQAEGVTEGGVLDHQLRELEVECLALEVPEQIVLDISELTIGDARHVSDLEVPSNITVLTDAERAVAAVLAPRVVEEEVEEEEEGLEGEEGAAEGEEAEGEGEEGSKEGESE